MKEAIERAIKEFALHRANVVIFTDFGLLAEHIANVIEPSIRDETIAEEDRRLREAAHRTRKGKT